MPPPPRPIFLTLTEDEAAELLAPAGNGGQQTFHEGIIAQLQLSAALCLSFLLPESAVTARARLQNIVTTRKR